jgi:hypothetical protein
MNMKYNIFIIAFLLLILSNATTLLGQGVGINSTNSTPDASAMLDVESTDKGILIPRMTTTQRTTIATPATGLLVFDNTSASFWFYNGVAWTELGGDSPFTKTGTVVLPNTTIVDETIDDFVFGSTQLDDDGNSDHDNRLFFDKSKGAFRAGQVISNTWNASNMGNYSAAFGRNTKAAGNYSLAAGQYASAGGTQSAAWGYACSAAGSNSTAFGYYTEATATYSTAWGYYTDATGQQSTAWGNSTDARSAYETAMGSYNTDYTPNSTSSWDADDRLFSIGNGTSYSNRSNALSIYKNGTLNINDAYDMPTTDGTTGQVLTTNGAGVSTWATPLINDADADPNNELNSTIVLNGTNLEVTDAGGTITSDLSSLQIFTKTGSLIHPGSTVDETADDFVFGATQLDDDGNTNHDSRFFFDKSKSAFRAGKVTGTHWDDANLGQYSVAFGYNTMATNYQSVAFGHSNVSSSNQSATFGYQTTASGTQSTAFGYGSTASLNQATAFGYQSTASNYQATAFGYQTTASGLRSTSLGRETVASGDCSISAGYQTTASGEYAAAFGERSTASGDGAIALGRINDASGDNSSVIGGTLCSSDGNYSMSWGSNSDAIGTLSTSWGSHSDADGYCSTAGGHNVKANASYEVAFGRYTTDVSATSPTGWTSSDRIFTIGNGTANTSSGRSDAFTIFKNGNATLAGTLSQSSDRNLKKNINKLSNSLDNIMQISGYSYNWKEAQNREEGLQIGVIAQEVEALYPELVRKDSKDNLTVIYTGLIPVLIEATKEQQITISSQQILIDDSRKEIEILKTELKAIKDLLKK